MYVVKAAKTTFVQKICTFNVDEIDTRSSQTGGIVTFVKASEEISKTIHVLLVSILNPRFITQFRDL